MKSIKILTFCVLGATLVAACANSEKTAEQTAATAASCGAPTMDGTAREVASTCISGDKEHIRLEGVTVSAGQTLVIYADATDGGGTKGWEITFHGTSGKIYVKNTVNGQFMSTVGYTLSTADTYCVDIHRGSEDPRHIVIWKTAAKCDQTLSTGQWGSANFNSNDHAVSGADYAARPIASVGGTIGTNDITAGLTACNGQNACFAGGNNPDTAQGGSKFFYKGPAGSLSSITVKNHLSSGL